MWKTVNWFFQFSWKEKLCLLSAVNIELKFFEDKIRMDTYSIPPPRTYVLAPKIWRYRTSLKNPGTGAETHKWNFCHWELSGLCHIFCSHQIKGTVRSYWFKNVRPWGGVYCIGIQRLNFKNTVFFHSMGNGTVSFDVLKLLF